MAVTKGTLRAGGEPAKTPREEGARHTCTLSPIEEMSEDSNFFYLEGGEGVAAWVPLVAGELLGKSDLSEVSFAVLTHHVIVFMSQHREILLDPSKQDACRPMVYRFARQVIPEVWGKYMQDENFNPLERFAHVYRIVRDLIEMCLKIDVEDIPTETRRVACTYQWSETPSSDELQTSLGNSPENLKMLEFNYHIPIPLEPKVLIYRSDSTIAKSRLTKDVMGNRLESALLSTLSDLNSLHSNILENMHGNRALVPKENFEPGEMIWSTPLLGLNIGGIRRPVYVDPKKVMLHDCMMPVMPHKNDDKDFQNFCSSGTQSPSRDDLVTAMKRFKLNPDSAGPKGIQKRRHIPKTRSPLQKMQLACDNACQYDSDFDRFVNHKSPPINNSPGCIWFFE